MSVTLVETCSLYTNDAKVVVTLAYSLIFIVSLVGNILVVLVVRRNRLLRNSTNYFIVNMAISDLLVPTLVIPRVIKEAITGSLMWEVQGAFGEGLCKTIFFLSDLTPAVSILSLIFISLDRLHAVAFPLRTALMSRRVRAALIVFTWLISCMVFAPYFYAFKLQTFNGVVYCNMNWEPHFDHVKTHEAYSTFLIVTFIVIPFIILAIVYACICTVIMRKKVIGETHAQSMMVAMQTCQARKVIKLAVTVVLSYVVCWGPYSALLMLLAFKWGFQAPEGCVWQILWFTSQFLAFANAAVNPTVYFIFIQAYRQGLRKMLASWGSSWRKTSRSTISSISRHIRGSSYTRGNGSNGVKPVTKLETKVIVRKISDKKMPNCSN